MNRNDHPVSPTLRALVHVVKLAAEGRAPADIVRASGLDAAKVGYLLGHLLMPVLIAIWSFLKGRGKERVRTFCRIVEKQRMASTSDPVRSLFSLRFRDDHALQAEPSSESADPGDGGSTDREACLRASSYQLRVFANVRPRVRQDVSSDPLVGRGAWTGASAGLFPAKIA
ncbi:MAG: hypothetical protein R3C97_18250 [Geminicoccaceae bacterium]